jgi:hypothetical protein
VRDAERLARRQPVLFFGGAFAIGLALGRFLKNEPPARDEQSSGEWSERHDEARVETRRSPPPSPSQVRQQRYRENYDATFARDLPSSPAVASSAATTATSVKAQPQGGEPSPESNGGRRGSKGKTS